MSKKDFSTRTGQQINELLTSDLCELPPSDTLTKQVSPWYNAIEKILFGLAFNAFTFHFLLLDLILTTLGNFLLFLGFRTLRRENRHFKLGFVLSSVWLGYRILCLILNATIWQNAVYESSLFACLRYMMLALFIAIVICLRNGFRSIQRKTGIMEGLGSTNSLVIWYLLLTVMSLLQFNHILVIAAMIIAYFCLLRNLSRLSRLLDKSGYAIQPAPLKISSPVLVTLLCAVLASGITCGYLFCDQYPMDWSVTPDTEQANCDSVRDHLLSLGFPENVLNDLTTDDLIACSGAVQIIVDTKTCKPTEYDGISTEDHSIAAEVMLTTISVQLTNDGDYWKVIHHFQWLDEPQFHGTDALVLWPTYACSEDWFSAGGHSGRVLYTENEMTYSAPFYAMYDETKERGSIFHSTETYYLTEFSFPDGKEDYRGYATYDTFCVGELHSAKLAVNYVMQCWWMQYPVETAADVTLSDRDVFTYAQAINFLTPPLTDTVSD